MLGHVVGDTCQAALRSLYGTQGFRGLNDVIVDKQGGIYFTEPNGSSVIRPIGRVYYMPPSRTGELQLIGDTFAFPNGAPVTAFRTTPSTRHNSSAGTLCPQAAAATNNKIHIRRYRRHPTPNGSLIPPSMRQ